MGDRQSQQIDKRQRRLDRLMLLCLFAAAIFALVSTVGCGAQSPSATASPSSVTPELSKEEQREQDQLQEAEQLAAITDALNASRSAVHNCWARGASDDFQLKGAVQIVLTMNDVGAAKAELAEENVNDTVLVDCLLGYWNGFPWPAVFVPGDQIKLPPFEFVAPKAQYVVSAEHITAEETETYKRVSLLHKANTGNGDAAMHTITVSIGKEAPIPPCGTDQIIYVISGQVSIVGDPLGFPKMLGPDKVVYMPSKGKKRLALLASKESELLVLDIPGTCSAKSERQAVTGTLPAVLGNGVSSVSADMFRILPGKALQPQAHPHGSQYFYVLQGALALDIDGQTIPVGANDAVQVPRGLGHSVKVVGNASLKAIRFAVETQGSL